MALELTPHDFIEILDSNRHIMLLYEEPVYAKEIEFLFIIKGLEKGECCIYIIHDDNGLVEKQMKRYGIDTDLYISEKLLHVIGIDEFRGRTKNQTDLQKLFCSDFSRFRVAGRWVQEIDTNDGIRDELEIEKQTDSTFGTFNGSILCSYPVEKIYNKNRAYWTMEIMKAHDTVIFVNGYQKGTVHDLK